MDDRSQFLRFADRLLAGEETAANEMWQRYSARLVALASQRLHPRLRSRMDADDIVQSVMRSFFFRLHEGHWELRNWSSLWGLLSLMVLRKCSHHLAAQTGPQRDIQLELQIADDGAAVGDARVLFSREPDPQQVALLVESVDSLLCLLDDVDRTIVELILAGYSTTDVATRLGCSVRTVQRRIFLVRTKLVKQATLQQLSEGSG